MIYSGWNWKIPIFVPTEITTWQSIGDYTLLFDDNHRGLLPQKVCRWSTISSMITSSNGNIFLVTGLLCGIPLTKANDAELWCSLMLIWAWTNSWPNYGHAGDLRRYRASYYVTVMVSVDINKLVKWHQFPYVWIALVFLLHELLRHWLNLKTRNITFFSKTTHGKSFWIEGTNTLREDSILLQRKRMWHCIFSQDLLYVTRACGKWFRVNAFHNDITTRENFPY